MTTETPSAKNEHPSQLLGFISFMILFSCALSALWFTEALDRSAYYALQWARDGDLRASFEEIELMYERECGDRSDADALRSDAKKSGVSDKGGGLNPERVDCGSYYDLPPDPGEAGKATLEGIDSDGDGVRDDVQRWIVMTYPDEPAVRKALVQMARVWQASLTDAVDTESAMRLSDAESRAMLCLKAQPGYRWAHGKHFRLLRSVILNTYDRSYAYILFNRHLGGQILRMPEYGLSNCDN